MGRANFGGPAAAPSAPHAAPDAFAPAAAAGPLIGPAPPPAGGVKRQRLEDGAGAGAGFVGGAAHVARGPVVPPEQEAMPSEASMDLQQLRQRFEAFKQDCNAFAAETGQSVAVFTTGGVLSDAPDSAPDDFAADALLKSAGSAAHPRLKLAVLKYGSGGVGRQLVARPEIVKFVSARGFKALAEIADRAAHG
ncbi:hypothetical protein MNEG_1824 [Monoraphidium neglectum]|uniref:Uncharacterized protein n=1 Tax=Monoraphidium neglectum TaxID=145388 RepID=A0A0D2LI80_9CHLO|nr:hypothetical protein MNEG_1824 [Monoraphidium neglectum]KIZ06139.1 hypothetical protein MNEG_1824 [Monoraphidium neglectum]|eukprot:XP_013905158.1 hypothetical protein MNEG_1824 [Monoraphidium neglectum]